MMQGTQKRNTVGTERNVDILRLLRVVLKRVWIILLVAIICAISVFGYTKLFVAPVYRSSFTAYVNNRMASTEGKINTSDISASKNLTYLYQEIILSRSVLQDAAKASGLNVSYSTLTQNVKTSVAANAAIITVYVSAESPEEAEKLATAIASVAPDHVARVVDGSSMRIVDSPVTPRSPYAPNARRNAVMGFLLAAVVGCVLVILLDLITDKVASATEMEDRYGIAVVGIIPDMQQAERYHYSAAEPVRRKE